MTSTVPEPSPGEWWVYLVTNKGRSVLHVNITDDLKRTLFEHRTGARPESFAWCYQCWTLVRMEPSAGRAHAEARMRQLKNWQRAWKDALVERDNPAWSDLSRGWDYTGWFDPAHPPRGFYTQDRVEQWGGESGQR